MNNTPIINKETNKKLSSLETEGDLSNSPLSISIIFPGETKKQEIVVYVKLILVMISTD